MHAWAEVCHLLQSSKSPLTGFYAVLAEEPQAFFKHSPHTNSISNSAILRINYISLLSDFVRMRTCEEKKWRRKGSHSSSVSGSEWPRVTSNLEKKRWAGALLSENAAVLCENHRERVTQIWTNPSEEEEEEEEEEERKTFWPSVDFLVRYFCDAF